jgi:hypothetical protein
MPATTKNAAQFDAKVVSVGNSKGFRIEAGFFRQNPEFGGDAVATVVGPGSVLISAKRQPRTRGSAEHEDPVATAFLSFLEREMTAHPNLIAPLDKALIDEIGELVKDVKR